MLSQHLANPHCPDLHSDNVQHLEVLHLARRQLHNLLPRVKPLLGERSHPSPLRQLNGVKGALDRLCQALVPPLPWHLPLRFNPLSPPSRCRLIPARTCRFQRCPSAREQMMHKRKQAWERLVCSALLRQPRSLRPPLPLLPRLEAARSPFLRELAHSQSTCPNRRMRFPIHLQSKDRSPHQHLARADSVGPLLVNLGSVSRGSVRRGSGRPCRRRRS